jgi:hypothetical protein
MNDHDPELLIQRVLEPAARPNDWLALEASADRDPQLWREVVLSLRDQSLLRAACEPRLPQVELPLRAGVNSAATRLPRALVVLCAAVLVSFVAGMWSASALPRAVGGSVMSPADEFAFEQLAERYLRVGQRTGRVLQELPSEMLQTVPTADGNAVELFYVRRLLERKRVGGVFRVGTDEHGLPAVSDVRLALEPKSSL